LPLNNDSKSSQLYQDCSKISLEIFIDCLIDNNLTGLGEGTTQEREAAWDKIYLEFCNLSQSTNYNQVFELMKDINDNKAKITIVDNIVKHLQLRYDEELIDLLNIFALPCDITADDVEEILVEKLNVIVAYMKRWYPRLEQKEKELDELRSKNTGKMDRAYFDEILEIMSERKGYMIEASKITVSRFCISLVKMNEAAQKINNGNTTNR
jgi:hypothetical protein